jgi:Recombination endonuclease VII
MVAYMTYEILRNVPLPKKHYDKRFKSNSPQKIAAQNGMVHFQGNPCVHGHSGLRYTKGAQCIECMGIRRGSVITPRGRSATNHEKSLTAASSGNTTYVPNTPCKYGHYLRFINSNNCVQCDKDTMLKYRIDRQFSRIEKLYGLSKDAYLSMVNLQNSSCALCSKFEFDHFKLHVDHCHYTNKVRGLLCSKCNQGIGLLKHDASLISKAVLYCS